MKKEASKKTPTSSPFIWGLALPLVWGRDGASPAREPSLSHIARTQGLTTLPVPPGGTAKGGRELLMTQRARRCKSPAFILVHSTAREPKQDIANSTVNRSSQQQVLGSASRSGNFFWDLRETPGSSLEAKLQSSSLEEVCRGVWWGGLLLAKGFDLWCCGEAAKACQLWDCYPLLLFMGAPMISGETWSISSMTAWIWGWWPRAWWPK